MHYGFCTATCPTYVLFRDENDSPRGRIDLIRAMLEKGGAPEAKTVHHLDRCLSCLSCMTTCAVKVDYTHLIDIARSHIEQQLPPAAGRARAAALLARALAVSARLCAWRCALAGWRGHSASCCRGGCAIWSSMIPARGPRASPCAAGVRGGRRAPKARGAAGRLRAAGARRRHQRRDHPAAAAAWLRGRDRAGRGLLRRADPAYGPRG